MKLGSELKVPFEPGELVQTRINGESVIGEVRRVEDDGVVLRWDSPNAWRLCFAPWWSGPSLVRPAIRGYPYERKLSDFAWALFWICYLPYRLRRRLFARSVGKGGKLW